MSIEELLKPRVKVIADWPYGDHMAGDILPATDKGVIRLSKALSCNYEAYPHLFELLPWYVGQSFEDLISVKYVKVVRYVGYWRVGDIVPVEDYDCIVKSKYLHAYILKYKHAHQLSAVIPATEQDYNDFLTQSNKP